MKLKSLSNSEFKDVIEVASFFEGRKKFPRGTKSVLQAIKTYLARQRQGTVKTKTKADVRGGGKKPFKQKGTGNARQGSTRNPHMPGGGAAHGPKMRPWDMKINRKEANLAFKAAFVDHVNAQSTYQVDGYKKDTAVKSKGWRNCFDTNKKYIVLSADRESVIGARNFPNVRVVNSKNVNTYDLVWADAVVFRQSEEVDHLKARLKK